MHTHYLWVARCLSMTEFISSSFFSNRINWDTDDLGKLLSDEQFWQDCARLAPSLLEKHNLVTGPKKSTLASGERVRMLS